MDHPSRRKIRQTYTPYALLVGVTPTPLNTGWQQANLDGLYDSILISVPTIRPNVVFLGDSSIRIAAAGNVGGNGLEIKPGIPIMLSIVNERQLYELQSPIIDATCQLPEEIPFICWDPATTYLVAVAPTSVGIILFSRPYI
jgi:hypothetical protein